MGVKFVAFDVETPNHCNDRICSIGISVVEDDYKTTTEEFLINPECEFDQFNVNLHGVSPLAVKNEPSFPDFWSRISPLFTKCLVVAHNANFDICVLKKTLAAYNIPAPEIHYLDTLEVAQFFISDVENYKLPTLCNYYDIPLNHHNAGSDSEACARILSSMISLGVHVPDFIHTCSLKANSRPASNGLHCHYHSDSTKSLSELNSILKAIACDGVIANEEIEFLVTWMNCNSALRGNYPYDRIYDKLSTVLSDGIIDSQESKELLELFQNVEKPLEHINCNYTLSGFNGKNICLSGDFDYGSKDDFSTYLSSFGAIIQKNVTQKTNILIVGDKGSSAWSMGNYGTKIKKAIELQEKGFDILIIKESDFFTMNGDK